MIVQIFFDLPNHPTFHIRRKVGLLRKRKRVLCCSIYIISLCLVKCVHTVLFNIRCQEFEDYYEDRVHKAAGPVVFISKGRAGATSYTLNNVVLNCHHSEFKTLEGQCHKKSFKQNRGWKLCAKDWERLQIFFYR